jgi:2-polyprenyl-3-methyl-5-hydroxy-6-metoxy-1,4-benzoquinol methylase
LRVPWIKNALFNFNKDSLLKQHDSKILLKEPLLGLNILDVGCGGGLLSEVFLRLI